MPMVDNLSERFRENVERSTHVDVAVAWATKTSALNQLKHAVEEYDVALRIIVGTYGNATDPDALDSLNDIGELRLAPDGPLFHPKVYIFRGKEDSIAWIGSANFTQGGFGGNVEAVFETKRWESVSEWFENQWNECGELPANAIAKHRSRRFDDPPTRVLMGMMGTWERYRVRHWTGDDSPGGRDIIQPMSPTGKLAHPVPMTREERQIAEAIPWTPIEWNMGDRVAFQWDRDECYVGTIIGVPTKTTKMIKISFDFQRAAAKEDGVPFDSKGYTVSTHPTNIRILGRVGDRRARPNAMPLERIKRFVTDVGAPGLSLDRTVPKDLPDRSGKVVQPPRARKRIQRRNQVERKP